MSYTEMKLNHLLKTKELIRDAINAKGQKVSTNDTFRSYADKIAAIKSSSDDVRYVTFMSYDGSTEEGKIPVAVGYDCPNPKFTSTRESDAQYDYVLAGWATEVNGALNDDALKAVTEDRTVYANFAAVVRSYTITYYDSDGTTVLKTESLPYGSMPSYVPEKSGENFDSWNPALVAVKTDASYTAVWAERVTFAGGSWANIAAVSENGQAADYFAIGDTRVITVNGTSITLRIIGFDHDTLADGSGKKAGMTIFAEKALPNTMTAPNWGSVANSMKTIIKPQLPSELQAVIKPVLKKCDATTPLQQVITPTEISFDLFPLSWDELGIKRYAGRLSTESDWRQIIAELGTTYDYFAQKYNKTYMGPYVFPWSSSTGSWFRQYFRMGTKPGISHTTSLNTTSAKWGELGAATDAHPVLFAFCI